MIGSSSITLSKFKRSEKGQGYLFQKRSCSTELEITTLYVYSRVCQFSKRQRSSWLISPRFCFKANRDALHWTFSKDSVSFLVGAPDGGSVTYSSIGLTNDLKRQEKTYR